MAWTTADLTAIEKAIATGQRRVRLGLREIEYNTIGQMFETRNKILSELNKANAVTKRPNAFYARTSKGL